MDFSMRGTTKQPESPFPQCVCVRMCLRMKEGILVGNICGDDWFSHIFRAITATKTCFYSKHAQQDNNWEGADWHRVCLSCSCLISTPLKQERLLLLSIKILLPVSLIPPNLWPLTPIHSHNHDLSLKGEPGLTSLMFWIQHSKL